MPDFAFGEAEILVDNLHEYVADSFVSWCLGGVVGLNVGVHES